jgi:hypothetical protein
MRRDPRNRRGESGQVLIYVTLALVLALLIIPPLLGFVFTGGRSAQIREDRMLQVHAADAGIEDGYCFVVANATALPGSPEDPPTEIDMGTINGYDVNVQIFKDVTTEGVYKLLSTATSDGGRELRIESYTSQWDYSALMANALTSRDMIDVQPGITITGNVSANDLDKQSENNILKGMDGELHLGDTPGWPEADELADFYYGDVEGYPPYSSDTLDINTLDPLGDPLYREIADPLYREGDLYMISGNHSDVLTLTLGGTVYVTGDLLIGKTAHPFTLDLAGQTIFCEQSIRVGGSCNLVGPGCISYSLWPWGTTTSRAPVKLPCSRGRSSMARSPREISSPCSRTWT